MNDLLRPTIEWIKFTPEFGSNHRGKYKKHGDWAFPVFPSNRSLVGSVPTPYIFDDRAEPHDIAEQIMKVYKLKMERPDLYKIICKQAHEWVVSDESMMTARKMAENVIDAIDTTFKKWQPRYAFELMKIEPLEHPKHFVKHVIAQ